MVTALPQAAAVPRGVVTPEAVRLEFDTAGVAARLTARVVDAWVSAAVFFAVAALASAAAATALPGVLLAAFSALFAYPAAAEAWRGTTVGKSMVGLRVITVEGGPPRLRHTAVRSALQVVDIFLVPVGVVAMVSAIAGRDDQRLGDRLAGTLVVRSASVSLRARAVAFPPLPGYEGYVATLDVSGLRPRHYEVLRSLLTRVGELRPEARARLVARLVGPTARALGQPPPPAMHPEVFLVSVVAAYQRRHGGPATWMWGPTGRPPGMPA